MCITDNIPLRDGIREIIFLKVYISLTELPHIDLEVTFGTQEQKFIDALKNLANMRDNRGKRHSLVILIVTVVFATLVNRSKVSSIHRYMSNRIHWLREITGVHDATVISTKNAGKDRLGCLKCRD